MGGTGYWVIDELTTRERVQSNELFQVGAVGGR